MASRQTLVVVGVVLVATLAVAVPAVSAGVVDGTGPSADAAVGAGLTAQNGAEDGTVTDSTNASTNETEFGTQMAAFMQSNAAQVDDSVDNGMWRAAFERANESERARMAHAHASRLDETFADLAARNQSLSQRYRNGSLSYEAYVVQASQLNGRMEALEDGVTGTARAAQRAGVNVSALDELRETASNLTGPEVAGVARGLVDGDRGPPEGVPGRGPQGEDDSERPGGPPANAPGGDGTGPGGENATNGSDTATNGGGDGSPGEGNRPHDHGNAPGNPGNAPDGGDSGNATGGPGPNGSGSDADPGGRPNPGAGDGTGPQDGAGDGPPEDAGNGAPGNPGNGPSDDSGNPNGPAATDSDGDRDGDDDEVDAEDVSAEGDSNDESD